MKNRITTKKREKVGISVKDIYSLFASCNCWNKLVKRSRLQNSVVYSNYLQDPHNQKGASIYLSFSSISLSLPLLLALLYNAVSRVGCTKLSI